MVGRVWPGTSIFPDLLHPNITEFYYQVSSLYRKTFDGFWLDMNEISNFCDGHCEDVVYQKKDFYSGRLNYYPGGRDLNSKTIPMDVPHVHGIHQLEIHNLNGHLHLNAIHLALEHEKYDNDRN